MFTFTDLFAGIGGFHAVLGAMGGECWFASEIDRNATAVYDYNWFRPLRDGVEDANYKRVNGDIVPLTTGQMLVPPADVLTAGFPCQPFSKSGSQRGMDEVRGTLFWNIARVLEEHEPSVVMLENVRNLAGPRHTEEWNTIVRTLRGLGYRVASDPALISPHLLPPHLGGRPQVRQRVFILAHKVDDGVPKVGDDPITELRAVGGWDPRDWDLKRHLLQPDDEIEHLERYTLDKSEKDIIDAWDRLLQQIAAELGPGERLPGFPIWADEFRTAGAAEEIIRSAEATGAPLPRWKSDFLRKNAEFYEKYAAIIDEWLPTIQDFRPSRRKFEWQAQDWRPLDETVMHFRPSGLRAKQPTYVPALVAITQTSVIGKRRRITPREAARLQGLPDWFEFKHEREDGTVAEQPDPVSYRQMGNGVNVGAAYFVFRQYVLKHRDEIGKGAPHIVEAVYAASENPDEMLEQPLHQAGPRTMGPEGRSRGPVLDAARETETALS